MLEIKKLQKEYFAHVDLVIYLNATLKIKHCKIQIFQLFSQTDVDDFKI